MTHYKRADFHLKLIHQISNLINQCSNSHEVMTQTVETLSESLHFDVVSIYIYDKDKDELVLKASKGLHLGDGRQITLNPSEGLTGLTFTQKKTLHFCPASKHPNYKYFPEIKEKKYESYIGIPLMLESRAIGVLVCQTTEKRAIHAGERDLLEIISIHLAGVLEVSKTMNRLSLENDLKIPRAFQGVGISKGFSIGSVYILKSQFVYLKNAQLKVKDKEKEIEKLNLSIKQVYSDIDKQIEVLNKEKKLSSWENGIFKTHQMILKSQSFNQNLKNKILVDSFSAESAVIETINEMVQQFTKRTVDSVIKDRMQDLYEIGKRILDYINPSSHEQSYDNSMDGSIIVADHIGPSTLVSLMKKRISGIVTEQGGETSHAAILAKSLGIPFVSGVENITQLVQLNNQLLIDGRTGFVFVNPEENLIKEYQQSLLKRKSIYKEIREQIDSNDDAHKKTTLTTNIAFESDINVALQENINEVGLFRTEFAFMQFSHWPSIEQQMEIYLNLAEKINGSITIRLLDIGADKKLPYLIFPKEENALLGLRSIRFLMDNLDLLSNQLESIILASQTVNRFKILLPMVTQISEVLTVKEMMGQLAKKHKIPMNRLPSLGIMLEVPSMIYMLQDFKGLIDFISIGTNDFIQYILSVDRDSETVRHLYSGFHPSVIRALNDVCMQLNKFQIPVNICGEFASSYEGALALRAMGYDHFSVIPSKASHIRYLIQKVPFEIYPEIKDRILFFKKTVDIKNYLNEILDQYAPLLLELD